MLTEPALIVGICLILFASLMLAGILAAIVSGRIVTRRCMEDGAASTNREILDRTADRDGWRNLSADLIRRMERQEATNAILADQLRKMSGCDNAGKVD